MAEKQYGPTDEDKLFEELAQGYLEQNKHLFKDGIEPDLHSMAQSFKLIRQFSRESDRASVIIAAIMLENALTKVIKDRLINSPSKTDALFDGPNAPMGNFSAKINLAYRIGLIPLTFYKGLEIIRKIRNDFAHNISDATLDSPFVAQRIKTLIAS